MATRIRSWGALALLVLLASCGGKSSNESDGSGAAPGSAGAEQSAGANGGAPAGAGGECMGTLDEASKAWGFSCPASFCDATSTAACSALPGGIARTSQMYCLEMNVITFDVSRTQGKSCYYGNNGVLAGAAAWDSSKSYCHGTASRITSLSLEGCENAQSTSICDSANAGGSSGGGPTDAGPLCFNLLNSSCTPCCPNTKPDCTGKPDGYPGYACTPSPSSAEGSAYCSCLCASGMWQCAC